MIDDLQATSWDALKARYDAREDAGGGQILSADIARELSPGYLADRTLSNAVHEPSSGFIKRLYAERLAEAPGPGRDAVVMFTAGGTGAGKSVSLTLDGPAGRLQKVIRELDEEYADEPRVTIEAVNNTNGHGKAVLFDSIEDIPTIDEKKLAADVAAALEEALQNGTITQEVYAGFTAVRSPSGTGVRGRDQRMGAGRNRTDV